MFSHLTTVSLNPCLGHILLWELDGMNSLPFPPTSRTLYTNVQKTSECSWIPWAPTPQLLQVCESLSPDYIFHVVFKSIYLINLYFSFKNRSIMISLRPCLFVFFWFATLIFFIIFYWLCYYSCLKFSLFAPPQGTLHFLRQSPHHCSCPWLGCIVLWLLHVLHCTVHPHGYSNYLFVLFNPLTSSPIPPHPLPSGNHQNALHIHDSVSVLFDCLVYFFRYNCW